MPVSLSLHTEQPPEPNDYIAQEVTYAQYGRKVVARSASGFVVLDWDPNLVAVAGPAGEPLPVDEERAAAELDDALTKLERAR